MRRSVVYPAFRWRHRALAVVTILGLMLPARAGARTLTRAPLTDLGTLGGPASGAVAINHHGQVSGTSATDQGWDHAFVWQDGGMIDLGTLGGPWSTAVAINDQRQVAGTSAIAVDGPAHAFVWQHGDMTDLGTLGGDASEARALNTHG